MPLTTLDRRPLEGAVLGGPDPGLERLSLAVDETRIRLRAEFAGVPLEGDDVARAAAVDWIRAGAPVGDERAFLRWLEARVGR